MGLNSYFYGLEIIIVETDDYYFIDLISHISKYLKQYPKVN